MAIKPIKINVKAIVRAMYVTRPLQKEGFKSLDEYSARVSQWKNILNELGIQCVAENHRLDIEWFILACGMNKSNDADFSRMIEDIRDGVFRGY